MENIFEGAKFGDKFLTKDGRLAVYLGKYYDGTKDMLAHPHILQVDRTRPDRRVGYNNEGHTEFIDGSPIISIYDTPKSPWIKCSERLPEVNQLVVLILRSDGHYIARYNEGYVTRYRAGVGEYESFDSWFEVIGTDLVDNVELSDVVAWMPIPDFMEE